METQTQEGLHPDNLAVDRFATFMKTKLTKSREKGRGGWNDETQCSGESPELLSRIVRDQDHLFGN